MSPQRQIAGLLALVAFAGFTTSRRRDVAPPAPVRPMRDIQADRVSSIVSWVLVQTAPTLQVLAISTDRERLRFEMNELAEMSDVRFNWSIRPAEPLTEIETRIEPKPQIRG